MQALEFIAYQKNGTIQVPQEYMELLKGDFRVIILLPEKGAHKKAAPAPVKKYISKKYGPSFDKYHKFDPAVGKPDRFDKKDKFGKPDKFEKKDKFGKTDKFNKFDKPDKKEKNEKFEPKKPFRRSK